jgi:hypothetical protein
MKEAKWCGRIIYEAGVRHDPVRIRALQDLPRSKLASELQQFLCAMNWMRLSMPEYNVQVRPLMDLMELAASGRTKAKVAWVELAVVVWDVSHDSCLQRYKDMLGRATLLTHSDPKKRVCVFTDASSEHWGGASGHRCQWIR